MLACFQVHPTEAPRPAPQLLSKRSWRFSISVGVLMNTRGLVEIIALNVGLTLGILSTRLFSILVLMVGKWHSSAHPARL